MPTDTDPLTQVLQSVYAAHERGDKTLEPPPTPKGTPKPQSHAQAAGPNDLQSVGRNFTDLNQKLAKTVPKVPSTQQDINAILKPYVDEMLNLGPEYQAEMDYLKPYMNPTPQTFSGVVSQSQADESPTGSKSVEAATSALASAMENEKAPGFGAAAKAVQQYEGTIPYSMLLQSVLEAGKNQILGYSTIPNLSNISAKAWPADIKPILPYLEQSIGYTQQGVPGLVNSAFQAAGGGGTNPAITPNAPLSNSITQTGGRGPY